MITKLSVAVEAETAREAQQELQAVLEPMGFVRREDTPQRIARVGQRVQAYDADGQFVECILTVAEAREPGDYRFPPRAFVY